METEAEQVVFGFGSRFDDGVPEFYTITKAGIVVEISSYEDTMWKFDGFIEEIKKERYCSFEPDHYIVIYSEPDKIISFFDKDSNNLIISINFIEYESFVKFMIADFEKVCEDL